MEGTVALRHANPNFPVKPREVDLQLGTKCPAGVFLRKKNLYNYSDSIFGQCISSLMVRLMAE